jgi:hypothetical protein
LSSTKGIWPGCASAEFVDGEPHIAWLQPLADVASQRKVGDDVFLAHVDDQARPIVRVREMRHHDFFDRQFNQSRGCNIDRERYIDADLGKNNAGLERAGQG